MWRYNRRRGGKWRYQVGGINFSIDDPDELKAQARELAFKAREKADSLAKIAGMKIKGGDFFRKRRIFSLYYGIMDAKGMGGGMETGRKLVEPGSQEVTVTMNDI